MITWLQVAALGTAAAVALPILIHLLSRLKPRVRLFPTLRWLKQAEASRGRRPLPTEWQLLVLRCLLLLLLAAALAQPVWQAAAPRVAGWVLLAPEWAAGPLPPATERMVDSLRQQGYQRRVLAPGFSLWDEVPSSATRFQPPIHAWALVEAAAWLAPPEVDVLVVPPTNLAAFQGHRPALPTRIRWLAQPAPDRQALSYQQVRGDSLYAQTWTSEALVWRLNWVPSEAGSGDLPKAVVLAEPAAAAAWAAAVASLRVVGPPRWSVQVVQQGAAVPPGSDLVIWWSDRPVPTDLLPALSPGGLLLRPADGPPRAQVGEVNLWPGFGQPLRYRQVAEPAGAGWQVVLRDEAGVALAWQRPAAQAREVAVGLSLDPAASSLATGAQVPALLHRLLQTPAGPGLDPRQVAAAEGQPLRAATVRAPQSPMRGPTGTPLSAWLGLLALGLFAWERYVSDRRNRSLFA